MVVRVALGLEYNGGAYCGWQTQPAGCSVQDHLERALATIHGAPVQTITAGRTDAGVHALAQVAHFETIHERPDHAWVMGANSHLPSGIAVLWARNVPETFHARFSALERRYRYVLFNGPVRPALLSGKVGWVHGRLDLAAMAEASGHLLGEHDFSAFRAAECQAKSPVRELRSARVTPLGDYVILDFQANAFLHHQVRNMVGALVWVGLGRRPADWVADVLSSRDRSRAAATFAAEGLYLAGVQYDEVWQLPPFTNRIPPFLP